MSGEQKLIKGQGALLKIPELLALARPEARRIAVITFGSALRLEAVSTVITELKARFQQVVHVAFSTELLSFADLDRVCSILAVEGLSLPDALISIGGGSVIDLTKLIKRKIGSENVLHIAAPTTAGTGSESTRFAVVYRGEEKHSIDEAALKPEIAVLDPTLLYNLPLTQMIAPLLDALSQAVESLWALRATEGSRLIALESIEKLITGSQSLPLARISPEDLSLLQEGANLSGRAIDVSRTTLAHALSYALTARHKVPHGIAVFLNLPRLVLFNADITETDCLAPEGVPHIRTQIVRLAAALGAAETGSRPFEDVAREASSRLQRFAEGFGIDMRLETYGIESDGQIAWLIDAALSSARASNNPRRASRENLMPYFKK